MLNIRNYSQPLLIYMAKPYNYYRDLILLIIPSPQPQLTWKVLEIIVACLKIWNNSYVEITSLEIYLNQ